MSVSRNPLVLAVTAAIFLAPTVAFARGGGPVPDRPAKQPQSKGATVGAADSQYGNILVDGKGFTLYLFTRDDARSRCYGACAAAWPPLLTRGEPVATGGARTHRLGTVKRRNGDVQVTYAGRPLYYYVGESQPGQILCQAAAEYGGTWLVVNRRGDPA
jgi:predicted lipoprotein with Yx(FWY)xxD motif